MTIEMTDDNFYRRRPKRLVAELRFLRRGFSAVEERMIGS
jgi:hypothetical protein